MTGEHYHAKKIVILPGSKILYTDVNTGKEVMVQLLEHITIKGGVARQNFNIKGIIIGEKNAKKEED